MICILQIRYIIQFWLKCSGNMTHITDEEHSDTPLKTTPPKKFPNYRFTISQYLNFSTRLTYTSSPKISRTHRCKIATYLIAEYHRDRLQITPLGKLCTEASAQSTLQDNFWKLFCVMAFRAAIVLLLIAAMSSKCLRFNISFIFGNRKKSLG